MTDDHPSLDDDILAAESYADAGPTLPRKAAGRLAAELRRLTREVERLRNETGQP